MKTGDLVLHKGTGKTYLVVKGKALGLQLLLLDCGTLGFMHKNWLEVIDESR